MMRGHSQVSESISVGCAKKERVVQFVVVSEGTCNSVVTMLQNEDFNWLPITFRVIHHKVHFAFFATHDCRLPFLIHKSPLEFLQERKIPSIGNKVYTYGSQPYTKMQKK